MAWILEESAAGSPELIIIDDFGSADPESVRALRLLGRVAAKSRAVIVVAIRDRSLEDAAWPPPVRLAFAELLRAGSVRTIELGPLTPVEGEQLLAASLGLERVQGPLGTGATELVTRSGGNPLFLLEWVDLYLQEGLIERERGRWVVRTPKVPEGVESDGSFLVPVSVRQIILDRFHLLDPEDRRLVAAGARLGPEFPADVLAESFHRPRLEVLSRLRALSARRWPIRIAVAPERTFAFDHDLVHEVIRDLEGPQEVRIVYERGARWWRAHRPEDPLSEARLWSEAKNLDETASAVRRAVIASLAGGGARRVPSLVRWLVDRVPPDTDSRRAREVVEYSIDRLRAEQEYASAAESTRELARIDSSPGVAVESRLAEIELLVGTDPVRAERRLVRLYDELHGSGSRQTRAARSRIRFLRAMVSISVHPPRKAVRVTCAALRALGSAGASLERCRLYPVAAQALLNVDRVDSARRLIIEGRRRIRTASLASTPLGLSLAALQSDVELASRDWRSGRRLAERLLPAWRRHRPPVGESIGWVRLASVELQCRELASAKVHVQRALDIALRLDIRPVGSWANALRGWIGLIEGDIEGASAGFRDSESIGGFQPDSAIDVFRQIGAAAVRATQGEFEAADSALASVRTLAKTGHMTLRAEFHLVTARLAEARGDFQHSRRELVRAWGAAQRSGSGLDRVGAASEMVEWQRRHGSKPGYRLWAARRGRVCREYNLDSSKDWTGIAFPSSGPPEMITQEPSRTGTEITPFRTRILQLLGGATPNASPGLSAGPRGPTLSEREIAARLGAPRDRLAQSLHRLLVAGLVERARSRNSGQSRTTYVYRLTDTGRRRVAGLVAGR